MRVFLVILLVALNTLDGALTLCETGRGLAVEANPLMAWLMVELGRFWLPAKIFFVGALGSFLAKEYNNKIARVGLWFTNIVFIYLLAYHLQGIFL